jgi:hypothetical protein
MRHHRAMFVIAAITLACGGPTDVREGGNGNGGASDASHWSMGPGHFTVGGTVSGLSSASTIVLQDDGGDDLAKTGDGTFTFATALKNHSTYDVTVRTQPSGETCTVANGAGTISGTNVTNVSVTCAPTVSTTTYTVGGTISGLSGTLVLQDDGGDDLTATADGSFTFATPLADGAVYDVTIASQPANQSCTLANKTGTIAGVNVTDVGVSCTAYPPFYAYAGQCIVDSATSMLTGDCMDLSTCAIGASTFCTSGANLPTVQAYCGPVLDDTACWF